MNDSPEQVPPTVILRGRMRWFLADIRERRDRYTPDALAYVRSDALALAVAAGAGDEHQLLVELAAARDALAAGDDQAEARMITAARKLLAAVQRLNADLPDEIYRAQHARVGLAPRLH